MNSIVSKADENTVNIQLLFPMYRFYPLTIPDELAEENMVHAAISVSSQEFSPLHESSCYKTHKFAYDHQQHHQL
jgi:hypothetical protein